MRTRRGRSPRQVPPMCGGCASKGGLRATLSTSTLLEWHSPGGDFLNAQKVTKDAVKGRVFRLPLPLTNATRNDQTRRRKLHSVRFP